MEHSEQRARSSAARSPPAQKLGNQLMRCSVNTSTGPCGNPVKPGFSSCRLHIRDKDLAHAYRLNNPELVDSAEYHAKASLVDLSQQIVLMRAMIERRLNMAGDTECEQVSAYNFVAAQLVNLTKMTESLVKLSKESGDLMAKADVETYVDGIVNVVIEELQKTTGFESVIDNIVEKIQQFEGK